jgi:hypothetical protein
VSQALIDALKGGAGCGKTLRFVDLHGMSQRHVEEVVWRRWRLCCRKERLSVSAEDVDFFWGGGGEGGRGRRVRHEVNGKSKDKNKQQAKETKEDTGQEMETAHD